jgi:hypothetical protein
MQKRCSKCSQMAEYSLVFVLSTYSSKRLQTTGIHLPWITYERGEQ